MIVCGRAGAGREPRSPGSLSLAHAWDPRLHCFPSFVQPRLFLYHIIGIASHSEEIKSRIERPERSRGEIGDFSRKIKPHPRSPRDP
jgi:hypothetical protein